MTSASAIQKFAIDSRFCSKSARPRTQSTSGGFAVSTTPEPGAVSRSSGKR